MDGKVKGREGMKIEGKGRKGRRMKGKGKDSKGNKGRIMKIREGKRESKGKGK